MLHNSRLIVIGLDGADWRYINPLVDEGRLPNLTRLIESGAHGPLRSTACPFTAMAWSSLLTGRNPGQTGIFDGLLKKPGTYETFPSHISGFAGPPVWTHLNDRGHRTIVVNVPMTYPLKPIDGLLISGFDTPLDVPVFSSSPEALAQLKADGWTYDLIERQHYLAKHSNIQHQTIPIEQFVGKAISTIDRQAELAIELMNRTQWDFFFTVCQMTDFINHRTTELRYIQRIYEAADQFIGRLSNAAGQRTSVMIVSDHGSRTFDWAVNLSHVLQHTGLVHYRSHIASEALPRVVRRLLPWIAPSSITMKRIKNTWDVLPRSLRRILSLPLLRARLGLAHYYSNIDWRRTKAYVLGHMGPVYLNLRGREPSGIVSPEEYETVRDQVIAAFESITNPEDNAQVFRCVRTEEIWNGADMDVAPDLVLLLLDERCEPSQAVSTGRLFERIAPPHRRGVHARNGIFVASGEGINPQTSFQGLSIVDVAPTILYWMDAPIPCDIDGHVILEAFLPTFRGKHPLRFAEAPVAAETTDGTGFSPEEMESVLEKLRGLGYVE